MPAPAHVSASWVILGVLALALLPGCAESHATSDAAADASTTADAAPDDASSPVDAFGRLDVGPVHCEVDVDCDDGWFCNGPERCVGSSRTCEPAAATACDSVCDEAIDRCCEDRDGDGHIELGCGGGDDCADDDPDIYPGVSELCGGPDQDCDPLTLGADGDTDGDGHANIDCCQVLGGGGVICGDDCDDGWAAAHPGAGEVCDLRDDDCDGSIDEGSVPAGRMVTADCDHDGYGDAAHGMVTCWAGVGRGPPVCPDGYWSSEPEADCNDDDPRQQPGWVELSCDGVDEDCDGAIDQTVRDDDGDGYPAFACDGRTDCDDLVPSVHPGAEELCDQFDTDCDPATPREDADYDGHLAPDATCIGDSLPRDDCDDTRGTVRPGGLELCNGIDDDCDAAIDGTSAYCRNEGATATECRDARCIDLACDAGLDRCIDPERCTTDVVNDEAHCGACDARCESSACVAGGCDGFADLAVVGQRTFVLTVSGRALEISATGATGGPTARAIGDGVRPCTVYLDTTIHCPGAWPYSGITVAGAIEVGAGREFQCARTESGRVWCWGWGTAGQLGTGLVYPEVGVGPLTVRGISDAIAIAVASVSACALRSGGEVRCWGEGAEGALGNGANRVEPAPVTVAMPTPAIAIAAGSAHVCALDATGSMWCWGSNARGQLGLATGPSPALSPRRVPLDGVVAIAAGSDSTCAITSTGELWCWGANAAGQLGDGTRVDRTTPVLADTQVARVTIGVEHACLLRPNGAMACWGENSDGRLGDGTRQDVLRPTPLDWVP